MPKITVHGGASIWDGNNSSPSEEKQQNLETKTEEVEEWLVPTMESPSEKDQTETSSAHLTVGKKTSTRKR